MEQETSEAELLELVVKPGGTWKALDLRELVRYSDLLILLVRRDFVAKYKQTVLGPFWAILQPLMMSLVFTVVFGNIAAIPTDGLPKMLFYLCGMLAWGYTAQCFQGCSQTLRANAALFSKVYFPRLIVPLAALVSNLIAFVLQLATFLCFLTYFNCFTPAGAMIDPNIAILLVPLWLLLAAAIALGLGLWMSALTAKYRDLGYITGFITQVWMYASPVIYPLSQLEERLPGYSWLWALNPMTAVVEGFRQAFFGTSSLAPLQVVVGVVVTLVVLGTGLMAFRRVEGSFVDTI